MPRLWKSLRLFILVTLLVYGLAYIVPARNMVRQSLAPFVEFTRRAGESVIDSIKLITQINTLAKENGDLRAKLNDLSAVAITNTELKHENDLLRKELSLSSSNSHLIAAQVISRDSSVSQQSIVVNKGTNDGFTKGMAVIAQGYLIGRVEEALAQSSRITLITSSESLLPVVLQNSRVVGVLRGGPEGLSIDEIPRDVTIAPDEAVVTSNTGDIIKSGIPVGTVSSVVAEKSDVFQSARINSPIDTSRLEVVFGVKN